MSLLLLAALAAAQSASSAAPQRCAPRGLTMARGAAKHPALHRLAEDPPAAELLAVVRHAGGCPVPAVVRTGISRR